MKQTLEKYQELQNFLFSYFEGKLGIHKNKGLSKLWNKDSDVIFEVKAIRLDVDRVTVDYESYTDNDEQGLAFVSMSIVDWESL